MGHYKARKPRYASFRIGRGVYRLDLWWKPYHSEMVRSADGSEEERSCWASW